MTRVKKSLTRSPDGFQPVAEIVKIFLRRKPAARDQTCKLCHNLFTTQDIGNHQKRCRGAQTKLSPLLMQLTNLNVSQVIWELSRQLGWQSNSRVLLQRLLALCYLRLRLVCSPQLYVECRMLVTRSWRAHLPRCRLSEQKLKPRALPERKN